MLEAELHKIIEELRKTVSDLHLENYKLQRAVDKAAHTLNGVDLAYGYRTEEMQYFDSVEEWKRYLMEGERDEC